MIHKVETINRSLIRRYPRGHTPFQIMTRIFEEGGELAQQVNHFEDSGIKQQKYGLPDRAKLAQEVKGLLLTLFQLVEYYELDAELEASLDSTLCKLKTAGLLKPCDEIQSRSS